MKISTKITSVLAVTLLVGCSNMTPTEQRLLSGSAIGAVGGAAVGGLAGGHAGTGALIGAGAGALGGYLYDQNQRRR